MNQRYMYNYMEIMYRRIRLQLVLPHSCEPIGLICLCGFSYMMIYEKHMADCNLADVLFCCIRPAKKWMLAKKEDHEMGLVSCLIDI